jgi:Holliday junction DNA helicase RuvA
MISSVRGEVLAIHLDHAVIEVGGVGLAVRTTPATLAELHRGEQARLWTTLVVREDSLTLFGFATAPGKELFELVQSVSGVGPKIALALLAVLDPDDLRRALSTGDTAALCRAPGIGKKSADRLVLELKDKVGAAGPSATPANGRRPSNGSVGGTAWQPLVTEALIGLGFTVRQADDAVAGVVATDDAAIAAGDVGVLLRRSLALLGRTK